MEKVSKISFFEAKNKSLCCKKDDILLHSAYDPQKQAILFCSSIKCAFSPLYIVITEPALSYCLFFLKQKFPKAKIICIRYCNDFDEYNFGFDFVLYSNDKKKNIEDELFYLLQEDGIARTLFLSWQPSKKAFQTQDASTWEKIKKVVEKAKIVMATRSYFSPIWLKNVFKFCSMTMHTAKITKGEKDIVIVASGESLQYCLPFLKEKRNSFFLLAVSSAIKPLVSYGIAPDLCLSCDASFWAKKHLLCLSEYDIPIALPLEASICGNFYLEKNILPLCYEKSLCFQLAYMCGIEPFFALRCGTVSGTALQFALNITTGNIFFSGLDLSPSKRTSHARPNALEEEKEAKDTLFSGRQTRAFLQSLSSPALDIYRDWFSYYAPLQNRNIFRISSLRHFHHFQNKITGVKDIDIEDVQFSCKKKDILVSYSVPKVSCKKRKEMLLQFLQEKQNHHLILEQISPAYKIGGKDGCLFQNDLDSFCKKAKRFLS